MESRDPLMPCLWNIAPQCPFLWKSRCYQTVCQKERQTVFPITVWQECLGHLICQSYGMGGKVSFHEKRLYLEKFSYCLEGFESAKISPGFNIFAYCVPWHVLHFELHMDGDLISSFLCIPSTISTLTAWQPHQCRSVTFRIPRQKYP